MHSDFDYVQYLLRGMEYVFQFGVEAEHTFQSASQNMQSGQVDPGREKIEEYITKQCS